MRIQRYLTLAALAALLGLGSVSGHFGVGGDTLVQAQGQAECTVTVQPGESIQAAIDRAAEGDVICLAEGTWEENIKIEKSLVLRGKGLYEHPKVSPLPYGRTVIKGSKQGYPVAWIKIPEQAQTASIRIEGLTITRAKRGCADEVKVVCSFGVLIQGRTWVEIDHSIISENAPYDIIGHGLVLKGSSRLQITNSAISRNGGYGIWTLNSSWAEISDCVISQNGQVGILLESSAKAIIERNEISGNWLYGVALYQWPCYHTDEAFIGRVSGRANIIRSHPEYGSLAVCPPELDFLMTEEGGCYGSSCE